MTNPLLHVHQLCLQILPCHLKTNYLLSVTSFLKTPDQLEPWIQEFWNHPEFPQIQVLLKKLYLQMKQKVSTQQTPLSLTYSSSSTKRICIKRKREGGEVEEIEMENVTTSTKALYFNPNLKILNVFEKLFGENQHNGKVPMSLKRQKLGCLNERQCKSCMTVNEIVEDVQEGHAVCIRCGTIQHTGVMETALTDARFHQGLSRDVVHRYSRWIYLRSIIQATLGETQIELTVEHREILTLHANQTGDFSPSCVKKGIRQNRLPYRLMRHATTIAWQLFPRQQQSQPALPEVGQSELARICRRFREYERIWDDGISANLRGKRKSFMSYRILWQRIIADLEMPHLNCFFGPMKNKTLHSKQERLVLAVRDLIN